MMVTEVMKAMEVMEVMVETGATNLYTDGEVVLLDPLEVQGLVDLHVGVGPAVLLPLLEVEGVVLVGLVSRPSN